MSYTNLIMYSSVLPSYNDKEDKQHAKRNIINADDPRNSDKIDQFGSD